MAYASDKEIHQLDVAASLTGAELVPCALPGQEATMTTTQDIADLAVPTFDATVDFSVNADPNIVGTTFSPNTPNLTTVIYVSTIDGSQWTSNGVTYTTYTSSNWSTFGNAGTTAGTNFIGTTDVKDFVTKTSNIERCRVSSGSSGSQLFKISGSGITNGIVQYITSPSVTTGIGLYIDANSITSGKIAEFSTSSVGNFTNGAVKIGAVSPHTGYLLNLLDASTAATVLNISAPSLTTGIGLLVNAPVLTTGNIATFTTGSAGTFPFGAVRVLGTSPHTGSLFNVNSATATGIATKILSNNLTTGTALDISTTSNVLNSIDGLLHVHNLGTGTSGVLARFVANSVSGSGATFLANGNNGFGIALPLSTLETAGSFGAKYLKVTSDNYNILSTDYTLSIDNGANNWTIILPNAATCLGRIYILKRYDSTSTGTITIDSTGSNVQDHTTYVFGLTSTLEAIGSVHATAMYQSNGTDWEYIK